jgi:hypothetical protein
VFYWAGRYYFTDQDALKDVVKAFLYGGTFYMLLSAYEIRMSPQLSREIYGFFPHVWVQHIRYGGYRPIVFMQHGLMVALWMAATTTVAFWLWRSREISHVGPFPMSIIFFGMAAVTILSRSANGWFFLAFGIFLYFIYKKSKIEKFLQIILVFIPLYIAVRLTAFISTEDFLHVARIIFDDERVLSLSIRLNQEELFGARALQRPLFGWGGYGRGWPQNQQTGQQLVSAVDSLWVILISSKGMAGLGGVFLSLGLGPWLSQKYLRIHQTEFNEYPSERLYVLLLSAVIIIFTLDALLNAMVNPIFIMCSGCLATFAEQQHEELLNYQKQLKRHRIYSFEV